MSHETFIEQSNNPGSYEDFRIKVQRDDAEITDGEAFELYGQALGDYRKHLAEQGGVAPEELHHLPVQEQEVV